MSFVTKTPGRFSGALIFFQHDANLAAEAYLSSILAFHPTQSFNIQGRLGEGGNSEYLLLKIKSFTIIQADQFSLGTRYLNSVG